MLDDGDLDEPGVLWEHNAKDHYPAEVQRIQQLSQKESYLIRGRQICVGECKFIFDRIWKATIKCQTEGDGKDNEEHIHHGNDGHHAKAAHERFHEEIHLDDLFHVLDLAGKLLNKKEIDENDTAPFDIFMKYS